MYRKFGRACNIGLFGQCNSYWKFSCIRELAELEMVGSVDTTVKQVTDICAHDLAKLRTKANSISLYYQCLEDYKTKPAEAVKVVQQF